MPLPPCSHENHAFGLPACLEVGCWDLQNRHQSWSTDDAVLAGAPQPLLVRLGPVPALLAADLAWRGGVSSSCAALCQQGWEAIEK